MSRATSIRDLDRFSQERFPELGQRLSRVRDAHRIAESYLWTGALALNFDDAELAVLATSGFMSPFDRRAMARLGRPIVDVPVPDVAAKEGA